MWPTQQCLQVYKSGLQAYRVGLQVYKPRRLLSGALAREPASNRRAPHESHTFLAVNLHSPRSDQTGEGFMLTAPGVHFVLFSPFKKSIFMEGEE